MELKLTKQKTIYKNLMKRVVFDIAANFPTKKFPDQNKVAKNKRI